MEINEKMYALAEKVKLLVPHIKTEESTKQSLILPFFQILGFDVFNPLEFCPEFTADVGIKKGEKVDYTILIDGKPLILIEAKSCTQKLDKHDSQLFRYFGTTVSKFAILTNGLVYKFFTDLDMPNKMDSLPFFELDMLDLTDQSIEYLENFMKTKLNVMNIVTTASELKFLNLAKNEFKALIENMPDEFVKMILSKIYEGQKNQAVLDKFKPIIRRGINQYINDKMSTKFKETLAGSETPAVVTDEPIEAESKIFTTMEELNAFAIVKSILRQHVSAKRLVYRDTETYLGILLDDNGRKWICRIETGKKLALQLPDADKKPVRYPLETLDSLYDQSDKLIEVLNRYL